MKVGLVGFPRAGKTTVFNALTGLHATVGGYAEPGKPNLGTIKVPDSRVDRLSEIFQPRKTTYAEIVFVDFPAASGEQAAGALDTAAIVQMRDADALVQVVRGFTDPISGAPAAAARDIDNFRSELILADLAVIEKRLDRLKKEKGKEREQDLLQRCRQTLDAEQPLRDLALTGEEVRTVAGFGFLSRLPLLVVINVPDEQAAAPLPAEVQGLLARDHLTGLVLCGQMEMEIAALDPADRGPFLADLGITESARDRFVRAAYAMLDLISFLTSGEDEVRAWTIKRGTTAVKAAGKIHSDIERGFIRAEVVHYDDFIAYGSDAKCREAGKLRLEGKDYVMRDGDIVHFRFNV
ncbi:MAG: redox-regulated ATPase YchF [Deltaproteobacteria bacterium]|nr:redox-regulated ATPase YchF [Deltaproteobacteria bacterium]